MTEFLYVGNLFLFFCTTLLTLLAVNEYAKNKTAFIAPLVAMFMMSTCFCNLVFLVKNGIQ